jgi:hypothetical protein
VEISKDLQKGKSLLLVGAMVGTSYRSHIDWPASAIGSCVTYKRSLNVYCPIFYYLWVREGQTLTLNLDVINIDVTSNRLHHWSCSKGTFLLGS